MEQEESELWQKQAERDVESAEKNIGIQEYALAAFLCQQAVEKALKALLIQKDGQLVKTHSVISLAKPVNIPAVLQGKIEQLESVYQQTRYPDIAKKMPAEEFDEQDAREFLENAKEVLSWVQTQKQ